jgi:hypothetical protein
LNWVEKKYVEQNVSDGSFDGFGVLNGGTAICSSGSATVRVNVDLINSEL